MSAISQRRDCTSSLNIMIVETNSFLASIGGSIDKDHYLRPIPGRPGYAAYCHKPRYTKREKQEMAVSPNATGFTNLNSEAKRQYNDPTLRAEWAKKHKVALRNASKHSNPLLPNGKPRVPVRLWDYVRQQLAKTSK